MNTDIHDNEHDWQLAKIDTFWNKIAFQKKVFHVCDNEESFMEILAGFVGTGINAGECTIVIASAPRLQLLGKKLLAHGLHVSSLIDECHYLPVPAETVLSRFMVNNAPDSSLFFRSISDILELPRSRGKRIRAYREMAGILLQQGNPNASAALENLWTTYTEKEQFSLFSAYPRIASNICDSLRSIGLYNCKVVTGANVMSKIRYRDCLVA